MKIQIQLQTYDRLNVTTWFTLSFGFRAHKLLKFQTPTYSLRSVIHYTSNNNNEHAIWNLQGSSCKLASIEQRFQMVINFILSNKKNLNIHKNQT